MEELINSLLDPNNKDNFTLMDEEGNPVEFEQILTISYNHKVYILAHPVLDEDPNGAALFMLDKVNDEYVFNLVTDPVTWTEVHDYYTNWASGNRIKVQ